MSHSRNGIAGVAQDGSDSFYDAEEFLDVAELPNGDRYNVTAYRNVKRV